MNSLLKFLETHPILGWFAIVCAEVNFMILVLFIIEDVNSASSTLNRLASFIGKMQARFQKKGAKYE